MENKFKKEDVWFGGGSGDSLTDAVIVQTKDPFAGVTNPPFGKKSSITVINENGKASKEAVIYERNDFWATTSNKQLNFVQHIKSLLDIGGQAAMVVPDNVLFEGGAGETIRRKLLHECDVHTLLRLPTGVFYAQGVKANVIFFDRKPASETPWTKELWIYDLRTNKHFTLKTNPLKYDDLEDFIKCYNPDNRHKRREPGNNLWSVIQAYTASAKVPWLDVEGAYKLEKVGGRILDLIL